MQARTLACFALGCLAASATAQITYIDANALTNTFLADGTPLVPQVAEANDNLWTERTTGASNNGTLLQANGPGATEDAGMIRTTISGLLPSLEYNVYAYFWGHGAYNWSGRAAIGDPASPPVPPLQAYESMLASGSVNLPMQPLGLGAPLGYNQTSLSLAMDAAFMEIEGHFTAPVKISDGTGWLFEVHLGRAAADINGEIHVYVDDLEFAGHAGRTWFDGVGYEMAPLATGAGCGNASIGMTGAPIAGTTWTIDLGDADPGTLALLVIGSGAITPFDIGLVGLTPGCFLNTTLDSLQVAFTDATGSSVWGGTIPIGLQVGPPISLFFQWAVFDFGFNVTEMTPLLEVPFHN